MGAGTSTGTRRRAALRTIAQDGSIVAAGVGTYFGVRGLTAGDADVARRHAHDVLRVEKELGLDVEAGIQSVLVDVDALTTLANWIYIWGHWPVIAVTMVWLALRDRRVFLRLRNAMVASGLMGLCVYTTYPVAPPRLAGLGFVDTITEQSQSYRVLQPPAFVNQYAAMPSLHVGWDLLVGLALVAAASSLAVRTLGRLMPVVMGAATVLTANHYVLDVLVGAAFGLAGWAVALHLERRRDARGRTLGAAPPPAAPPLPIPTGPAPGVAVPLHGVAVPRPRAPEACEQRSP